MKILAVDTSSKVCTVAITEDNKKIIELHNDDEKTHSVKLMPMIDEALKETKLTLDDIQLLVCAVGPGSFTGVRIGIATIKAFADVKQIPVVGVSSLESLAYNLVNSDDLRMQLSSTLFCSIIDAKNDNVYCGLYRYYNDSLNLITDLIAENINTVISKINTLITTFDEQFNQICFVGDGIEVHKDLIKKDVKYENINFASPELSVANGVNLAIAGYIKYNNGNYGDSNSIFPLYLRKSQAERELEKNSK